MINRFDVTNKPFEEKPVPKNGIHIYPSRQGTTRIPALIRGVVYEFKISLYGAYIIILVSDTKLNMYVKVRFDEADKEYIMSKLKPGMGIECLASAPFTMHTDLIDNGFFPDDRLSLVAITRVSTKLPFKVMYCANDKCNAHILAECNTTKDSNGNDIMQCPMCGGIARLVDQIVPSV